MEQEEGPSEKSWPALSVSLWEDSEGTQWASKVKWESSPSTDSPRSTTRGMNPGGEKVILTGALGSLENGANRLKLFQEAGKTVQCGKMLRTKCGGLSW